MFFFKNSAMSSDQKSFYDLEIESINGEIIKLNDYQNKVILVGTPLVIVVSQNNTKTCKIYGININPRVLLSLECPQTLSIKKKKPIVK